MTATALRFALPIESQRKAWAMLAAFIVAVGLGLYLQFRGSTSAPPASTTIDRDTMCVISRIGLPCRP